MQLAFKASLEMWLSQERSRQIVSETQKLELKDFFKRIVEKLYVV